MKTKKILQLETKTTRAVTLMCRHIYLDVASHHTDSLTFLQGVIFCAEEKTTCE